MPLLYADGYEVGDPPVPSPETRAPEVRPVAASDLEQAARVIVRPGQSVSPMGPTSADAPDSTARYEILGEIARGGMGIVLRGRDTELNRDLAVKVLRDPLRDQPEVLRRFYEEAQIGGQLQHPGIVPIYDIGTLADDRPFFAMKLVKGRTLSELLKERSAPTDDLPRFLGIFEQVAQTVAYAHSKGVIHRDLKPANIMVGAFGEVQVMDWGLAKVLSPDRVPEEDGAESLVTLVRTARSENDSEASVAGTVMGTYAYMPPEQANGEVDRVDERADVFGLGSILCEILTGSPAYRGSTDEIRRKAERADLRCAVERLDQSGAEPELVLLASLCLATDPSSRPADANVVARGVTAHLCGVQQRLRASEIARAEATARAETERTRAEGERARRKLTAAVAVAILLAAVVGGGSWMKFQLDRDARMTAANRVVGEALGPAETLREEAERDGPEALSSWERALSAAQRATDALNGRPVGPMLANRVRELYTVVCRRTAEVREVVRRADSMRKLVMRLDEAHLQGATIKGEPIDVQARLSDYEMAFVEAGINLKNDRLDAIVRDLAGIKDRERVAAAIDDWWLQEPRPGLREKLGAIARAIDPDRTPIRDALKSRDRQALIRLGMQATEQSLNPTSVILLASVLETRGQPVVAITMLGASRRRFPGDFWINHDLGRLLCNHVPTRIEEAVRYLTIAVALKPESVGALVNLAQALNDLGDSAEAVVVAREAVRLKPNMAHAHAILANGLVNLGRSGEAESSYRKAIGLQPNSAVVHINLGSALARMGRLKDAETSFREALRLHPDSAEAHYLLGLCLQSQGRYRDALDALTRSDDLGSHQPGWMHPSAAAVRECQALIRLEQRLPALIRGDAQPADEADRLALGRLCFEKRLYATAVRFWGEALAANPELANNLRNSLRFRTACAGVLAGTGQGQDDPGPDLLARATLLAQARAWLQADLAALQLEAVEPGNRAFVAAKILMWKNEADLAGVRAEDELAKLNDTERKAWRALWADADALLTRNSTR